MNQRDIELLPRDSKTVAEPKVYDDTIDYTIATMRKRNREREKSRKESHKVAAIPSSPHSHFH